MPRRGSGCTRWIVRTLLLGLLIVPLVAGLAFGALFLTSEAMGAPHAPDFEGWLSTALVRSGLQLPPPEGTGSALSPSSPNSSQPTETPTEVLRAGYVYDSNAPLRFTLTPSPKPTNSPTATRTSTPSPSVTASDTPTPSPTPSSTWTPSPTNTWPPTWTPTARPSRTPEPSATETDPTAAATADGEPTSTQDPTSPTHTSEPTSPPTATAESDCSTSLNPGYESEIVSLVNEARRDNGLDALSVQSQLRAAARVHATDMACNHFTSHTGSDGSTVRDRVEAQGYSWSWIGENYMVTRSGPQTAFDWWMNSTPHRNNILGSSYTEIGVGYIYGPDSDYGGYYVIVFARPG